MTKEVTIGKLSFGNGRPPLVIAGPCVIESEEITFHAAGELKAVCSKLDLPLVFKSSFDKANRSSLSSFRGPGIDKGLKILSEVKRKFGIPVISDIHSMQEIAPATEVLDAIQVPAFLCRQTDLILAASDTGKPVNVKKGQFLAPWDVKNIIEKFTSTGNTSLFITERGTSFGYNNLVVDFRGLPVMRAFGYPVIFDVTHSLQLPGGQGDRSGGQRQFAAPLARAAAAAGVDGFFMEVHPDPDRALCDGPNMLRLDDVARLLKTIKDITAAVEEEGLRT